MFYIGPLPADTTCPSPETSCTHLMMRSARPWLAEPALPAAGDDAAPPAEAAPEPAGKSAERVLLTAKR